MACNFTPKKNLATAAVLIATLLLSACSSSGIFIENSGDAAQSQSGKTATTPAAQKFGTGGTVIGLLVADEPGNLSDGARASTFLSARLAAQTLKDAQVSLIVRRYESTQSSLKSAVSAFQDAGVQIIVGPYSNKGAAFIAELLGGQNIPVMALGSTADLSAGIYEAGQARAHEVALVVATMKKRKYKSVVLAHTGSAASINYRNAISAALKNSGIKTSMVDLSDGQDAHAALNALARPDALLFATGPGRAAAFLTQLAPDSKFANIAIIGNSGWSTAPKLVPKGRALWYATPANSHLAAYSEKFAAAFNMPSTLRGAIVYDLVVMAGVLPQVVPDSPYAAEVLSNNQGFQGQTGAFKFDANGTVSRSYVIKSVNER